MIEATGAQIIVKMLELQGIDVVAGIPGGSILPLYDELARSSIKHVLVRQEQAGGFFAQGIARTTGNPAVCFATSGPGAMNLLTAIADARCDSIPLIAITGQVNTSLIGTDAFQEADTFGLSFPITKHSIMVKKPEELLSAIPQAFRIAVSGRPGPVLIDVPRDVQIAWCRFNSWPLPGQKVAGAERFQTEGDCLVKLLSLASECLLRANRPVLYAGGGCNSPEAAAALSHLQQMYPLPVVCSLMGLGCIPESSPAFMGMVGMHGSVTANRAMHDADVVLAIGVRFDDRATGVVEKFCPHAHIIHIDIDAAEINKILNAHISVVGDCASIIEQLSVVLDEQQNALHSAIKLAPSGVDRSIMAAESLRRDWLENLTAAIYSERKTYQIPKDSSSPHLPLTARLPDPRLLIMSLPYYAQKAGLSPDMLIVTTDVGQHQMWAAQFYPIEKPRTFLTSGSLGTMGFGLPVAIGAAWANPGKRVVCITGDGSIQMNIQELATLVELNLDVTILLLDNGVLGMVHQQQEILFSGNYSASVFEKSPDLLAVARSYGIKCADVAGDGASEACEDWYRIAFPFKGSGPRFVRCFIDKTENVYPFVPSGKANIEALQSLLLS